MKNGYKVYKNVILITTIIAVFVSLLSNKGYGYEFIYFVPSVYLVLLIMCKRVHFYSSKYNGLLILNVLMFFKYVVAILAICVTQSYTLPSYYAVSVLQSSYHWATFIVIGEEIAVFLTIELCADTIYKSKNNQIHVEKKYDRVKMGPVIYLFIILSFICAVLMPKYLFGTVGILFSSENQMTQTVETSHVMSMFFGAFKIIFVGLLINKAIVKYQEYHKIRYVIYSYLLIAVHCFFNISTSRMNIIIPFFLFVLITSKIYGKVGLWFNIVVGISLSAIIGVVSVYKMPWIFVGNTSPFIAFFSDFAKRLQEYTSNIMPTAMGLQAIEAYKSSIDITTFFKDIFGVMPIISHLINENEMIYTIYNQYALAGINNTQLIPMTISSIAYFTPIFAYLLVIICTLLLMKIEDKNNYEATNYINDYLKLYLFFVFASCTFSNVQMLAGRLFTNYIPAMVILYLNQYIGRDTKIIIGKRRDEKNK